MRFVKQAIGLKLALVLLSAGMAGQLYGSATTRGVMSLPPSAAVRPLPAILDATDLHAPDWTPPPEENASRISTEQLRRSLVDLAKSYGGRGYVPYVWGGNAIGHERVCQACRACIAARRHVGGEKGRADCRACSQCGVDCSHFVHRLLSEAGMPYPYLSTNKLKRLSAAKLRTYNLIDIGHDLRKAQPGDLLLHSRHIVMLLGMTGAKTGDFIHVNRSLKHGRVGGIEMLRATDLERYRGKVLRILRHVALEPSTKPARGAPTPLVLPRGPQPFEVGPLRIVRLE